MSNQLEFAYTIGEKNDDQTSEVVWLREKLSEAGLKLLQVQQTLAAVVIEKGTATDLGFYLDLPVERLSEVFWNPIVAVASSEDKKFIRLLYTKSPSTF